MQLGSGWPFHLLTEDVAFTIDKMVPGIGYARHHGRIFMKKKDHLLLGRFLLAKKEAPSGSIKRRLFLFGCVEPDINPFTYMRGSVRHQFLQGHNEENAREHFQKVLEKLNRSGVRTPWQWFTLGTLIHYAADSFTFPHNKSLFPGSLADHVAYELQLHALFPQYLSAMAGSWGFLTVHHQSLEALRKRYLYEAGSAGTDCRYILAAAEWIYRQLAERAVQLYLYPQPLA